MPAAAVIPAPRAYINVVAVKKPVVGFENIACESAPLRGSLLFGTLISRFDDILFDAGMDTCR